ncbi:hypothetical protein QQF64_033100, partial [Cirrhinus molitorella]
ILSKSPDTSWVRTSWAAVAESAANQTAPLGLAVSRGMLPVFVSTCQEPPGQCRPKRVSLLGGLSLKGVQGVREREKATQNDTQRSRDATHEA